MATSRSPSPAGPPPQESAPGIRATALQKTFDGALKATLSKCSYENFASCFPTTATYRPETLEGFWKDFSGRLGQVCKSEFETILSDRSVVPSLNSLDRLINEAKARKAEAEAKAPDGKAVPPVPPHTLPATELLNAHLSPFLIDQQTTLSSALATIQTSNETLVATITSQRAEMEALVAGLEAVVKDLEKSADMLQSDDVQGLSGDVRMIEQELAE
ncbi:Beta-catenin-like protein 1 [Venturia nashicola]|uniref:Beta-catenin-like protein 1 n=1 Tax=Venturia nashicola TaxID=86259 RepID=A0A4Z1PBF9_9PEZI|nr:Beta-catenin-like protein 1 [Venturia nashicola]